MPTFLPYASAEIVTVTDRGTAPARAVAGFDGGFAVPVRETLALYGGLGLRAHKTYLTPDAGLTGSAQVQAQAWKLPAGLWGSLGYAYRDVLAGAPGFVAGTHDLMATLERGVGGGATIFGSGGYEWGGSLYQGPFAGLGLRVPVTPWGVTLLADAGAAYQDRGAGGAETVGTFHLGVRRALQGGLTLWARGGPEFGTGIPGTTLAGGFVTPTLTAGLTWSLAAAPPRPVRNPLSLAAGPPASTGLAADRVASATRQASLWTGPVAPPDAFPGAGQPGAEPPERPGAGSGSGTGAASETGASGTGSAPGSAGSPDTAPAQGATGPRLSATLGGVTLGIGP